MTPALFLFATLACAPTAPADTASGPTGDTAADVDPNVTDDDQVNSWFPEDYAPTEVARVVFLGDSITAGNGASRAKLSYPRLLQANDGDAWPSGNDIDFPALFGESPEIIDFAAAGATTASLVAKELPHVTEAIGDQASGVTAVVVTIAGNDVQGLLYNTDQTEATAEKILDNLAEFYDYFQDPERFPDGSFIYLANVYEPSDGVGQADGCFFSLDLSDVLESLDYVNAATLEQAKERNVAWIDMRGHFLGHGFYSGDEENPYHQAYDPTLWFADDCIHPNDRGHHEIRRLMWYAMAGLPFPGDEPVEVE